MMTSIATQLVFIVAGLSVFGSSFLQEKDLPDTGLTLDTVYQSARKHFEEGDYSLALDEARELCLQSATNIRFHYLKGEIAFAAGNMADSIAAYDHVIEQAPPSEPQLWQRGLALYYANRFAEGVKQFETHQTVNSQDVENAVWHLLCAARLSDIDQARKNLIPIHGDDRVPMSQVYEMYAGRMKPEEVIETAARATAKVPAGSAKHRLQLYYGHLYIGLYWEMLGEPEKSLVEIRAAEKINPLAKDNFMGRVAAVHASIRETKRNLKTENPEKASEH